MRHAQAAGILDSMDARKMDMVVNKGVEMYGDQLLSTRGANTAPYAKTDKTIDESKNKKPDADGDGIPDWADKNPKKPGRNRDRKMNEAELSPKQRRMAALGGDKKRIDAADMAALRHGATIDEDDFDFDMDFGDNGQGMGMMHNPADDAQHDPVMHNDIKDIAQAKGVDIHHSDIHKHDVKHYEYQASMARSELYRNAKYAMAMLHQVKPDEEIQPWIAGALTKAANYLDKIYHYLDYYKTFEPEKLPEDMDADMELGETSGSIARQNLMMICEYSTKLFDMIRPGDHLEGWVAMKLTTASECVSSTKHYLEYVQFEHNGLDDHFDDARRAKNKIMAEGAIKKQKRRRRLAEQQDLEQAETLLAAKDLSDQLQQTAEKLAKMGVEDLMPLVDVMRQQFGPEAAAGFNDMVKTALDGLLDSTTQAKEQVDQSIDTLQGGGVPAQAGTPQVTGSGDEMGNMGGAEADMDAEELPAAPEEPLGRSKKEPMAEAQSDYAKRRARDKAIDAGKPVKPLPKNAKTDYESRRAQEKKNDMTKAPAATEKKPAKKLDVAKDTKMGKMDETVAPGQTDYSILSDEEIKQKANAGDAMAKTLMTKRKPANGQTTQTTQTTQESAPPGDKAERFIRKNKAAFNKRYGADRGEEVLYRTAWKQFGETSQAQQKAQMQLESVQAMIKNLNDQLKVHKADYRRQLKEGTTVDPLNTGYGLDGEIVMGKIQTCKRTQSRLQQIIESEQRKGIQKIQEQVAAVVEIRNLQSQMNTKPWGVVYRDHTGAKQQKFFESAATLKLWHGLNRSDITVIRAVKPQDWHAKINKLRKI
jgi:hypothetical protein